MNFREFVFFILLGISILGCISEYLSGLEDYYFSKDNLLSSKVYVYSSALGNNHPDEIWTYSTEKMNGQWHIRSKNYRSDLRLVQDQDELIVDNGSLLKSLRLISYDSLSIGTATQVTILHGNIFPFQIPDSNHLLLYKIQFVDEVTIDTITQSRTTTLTKNRIFDSRSTYSYQGKDIPAVIFNVKELIQSEENGFMEFRFDIVEIFAKGIGLVAYQKSLNGEIVYDYKLENIYNLDDFQSQYGILIDE